MIFNRASRPSLYASNTLPYDVQQANAINLDQQILAARTTKLVELPNGVTPVTWLSTSYTGSTYNDIVFRSSGSAIIFLGTVIPQTGLRPLSPGDPYYQYIPVEVRDQILVTHLPSVGIPISSSYTHVGSIGKWVDGTSSNSMTGTTSNQTYEEVGLAYWNGHPLELASETGGQNRWRYIYDVNWGDQELGGPDPFRTFCCAGSGFKTPPNIPWIYNQVKCHIYGSWDFTDANHIGVSGIGSSAVYASSSPWIRLNTDPPGGITTGNSGGGIYSYNGAFSASAWNHTINSAGAVTCSGGQYSGVVIGSRLTRYIRRFRLYNSPNFLNYPGSYVVDATSGYLYVYPPSKAGWLGFTPIGPSWYGISFDSASGLTFQNVGFSGGKKNVLRLNYCDNASIIGCKFYGAGLDCIKIAAGLNPIVSGCSFINGQGNAITITVAPSTTGYRFAVPTNIPGHTDLPYTSTIVRDLVNTNTKVIDNTFINNNWRWNSGGTIAITTVGATITGNTFIRNNAPFTMLVGGWKYEIAYNTFNNNVRTTTDTGEIYYGRSFIQGGHNIHHNTFTRVRPWYQLDKGEGVYLGDYYIPVSDVSGTVGSAIGVNRCVYLDDGAGNADIHHNTFDDVRMPIIHSYGRNISFRDNEIDTADTGIFSRFYADGNKHFFEWLQYREALRAVGRDYHSPALTTSGHFAWTDIFSVGGVFNNQLDAYEASLHMPTLKHTIYFGYSRDGTYAALATGTMPTSGRFNITYSNVTASAISWSPVSSTLIANITAALTGHPFLGGVSNIVANSDMASGTGSLTISVSSNYAQNKAAIGNLTVAAASVEPLNGTLSAYIESDADFFRAIRYIHNYASNTASVDLLADTRVPPNSSSSISFIQGYNHYEANNTMTNVSFQKDVPNAYYASYGSGGAIYTEQKTYMTARTSGFKCGIAIFLPYSMDNRHYDPWATVYPVAAPRTSGELALYKADGFDHVRLVMSPTASWKDRNASNPATSGNYLFTDRSIYNSTADFDTTYMAGMATFINSILAVGLNIVLDLNHYGGEYNHISFKQALNYATTPVCGGAGEMNRTTWALWLGDFLDYMIANTNINQENTWLELINEPSFSTDAILLSLWNVSLPVIRTAGRRKLAGKDWMVVLSNRNGTGVFGPVSGSVNWQDPPPAFTDTLAVEPQRLIYSIHPYFPASFSLAGSTDGVNRSTYIGLEWPMTAVAVTGKAATWTSSGAFLAATELPFNFNYNHSKMREYISAAGVWAYNNDKPIWAGETGTSQIAHNLAYNCNKWKDLVNALKHYGIPYCAWYDTYVEAYSSTTGCLSIYYFAERNGTGGVNEITTNTYPSDGRPATVAENFPPYTIRTVPALPAAASNPDLNPNTRRLSRRRELITAITGKQGHYLPATIANRRETYVFEDTGAEL